MVKGDLFSKLNQYKLSKWKTELVPVSKLTYNKVARDLYARSKESQFTLQESIRKNGLKYYPFITDTKDVLDGINRVEAYKALNITHIMCYVVELDAEEYLQFIVAANHRREKTKSEIYDEALLLVPASSQGKGVGGTDRYEIGAKQAGRHFSGSTLRNYEIAKEIHKQYPDAGLLKEFNLGTIKTVNGLLTAANLVVARYAEQAGATQPVSVTDKHIPQRFTIHFKECYVMVEIKDGSVSLTFTSPPYWDQRNYSTDKKRSTADPNDPYELKVPLGKEKNVKNYIHKLRIVFTEVYRVTKFRGSVFVNISDTYSCDNNNYVPELFCIMMSQIGFHKVNTIPWVKTNNRTRGNEDRRLLPTWEYLFHFVKKEAASSELPDEKKYFYKPFLYYPKDKRMKVHEIGPRHNKDGPKTKAKIIVTKAYKRLQDFFDKTTYFDVIKTASASADSAFLNKQYGIEHEAPFPLQLPLYAILSCTEESKEGEDPQIVLDPFMGSGTTAVASILMGRVAVGYECEERHYKLTTQRCSDIEIGLEALVAERRKSA